MKSTIYTYKSPSGKYYIGQTSNEDKRMYEHRHMFDKCRKFNNAIKKYGFDNFEYTSLFSFECDDQDYLLKISDMLERKLIKRFNSYNRGYNMTEGGKGQTGFKHSEASIEKMCEVQKRIAKRGKDHHRFGTTMKEDHPAKKYWYDKGHVPHNVTPIRATRISTGEVFEFDTIRKAAAFIGISNSTVCTALKTGRDNVKGYKLEYIERSTTSRKA